MSDVNDASAAPIDLEPGMAAPGFRGMTNERGEVALADFKGQTLVLYFYPRDNTPGCTTEAIDFSAAARDFEALGAVVIGVSKDSLKSHEKFSAKHGLGIALLSDPDLETSKAYGVWREKRNYGKTSMGVVRSTFVIDGEGGVQKAWRGVKVKGHVDEVLAFLSAPPD